MIGIPSFIVLVAVKHIKPEVAIYINNLVCHESCGSVFPWFIDKGSGGRNAKISLKGPVGMPDRFYGFFIDRVFGNYICGLA
jgi:hypothetical protein